ncbi:hypothetical protein [Dyadobacter arcticus]|uniref:Baseplate J-like protein n=1 Tax=Dyadobacter arcticus TaxID=1078754 RepID=A0ABX0UNY3_9BACT|nr:hypothetical protein [Dyadobacter arcticus]NIJ54698.1 hypothetical protein [Dyadobacter arcticus]
MKNCQCQTDIPREGSGQLTRFLKALAPEYARIDDRSFTDLLNFAKNYASHIRFYKLPDDQCPDEGSWRSFFRNDLTVLAASVAQFDLAQVQKDYLETRDQFEQSPGIRIFKALFKPIIGICTALDKWASRSSLDFPLRKDIELAIHSTLSKQIMSVYVLSKSAMLVNNGNDLDIEFEPVDDSLWGLDNDILINTTLYKGTKLADQLFHASLEIDTIFNACFGVITQIAGNVEDYLAFSLEKYPRHQPHMALFIAFLQLFKLAQDQLNGLTEKHLNYYYRDILHLTEKPAQPDHVNLIFELAKGTDAFALSKGTELSAGKDDTGVELVYETDRELVLNKAHVKEISTVFIETKTRSITGADGTLTTIQRSRLYSRPVANSADGFGKPFKEEVPKWHPFGADAVRRLTSCGSIQSLQGSNYAKTGFAMASPQLRLGSGQRELTMKVAGLTGSSLTEKAFFINGTFEKKWRKIERLPEGLRNNWIATNGGHVSTFDWNGFFFDKGIFHIFLPKEAPGLIPYDPEIHTHVHYATTEPVLEITFDQDAEEIDTALFDSLAFRKPEDFQLNIVVKGHTGVVTENEQGVQPADKPFYPFTLLPNHGSILEVRSNEIAAKRYTSPKIDSLETHWQDGKGLGRSGANPEVVVQQDGLSIRLSKPDLVGGNFELAQKIAQSSKLNSISVDYTTDTKQINPEFDQFFHVYPFGAAETDVTQNYAVNHHLGNMQMAYQVGSGADRPIVYAGNQILPGFKFGLRPLGLNTDVLKKDLEPASIDLGSMLGAGGTVRFNEFNTNNLRNALPNVMAISGARAVALGRAGKATSQNLSLLQQNQYSGYIMQEGNLYIGIGNLNPPQNLSLLFQIAEGSGMDDDKDVPPIHWSYLSNNYWLPLPASHVISDNTYGLQTTGIILLDIPEDATSNNTLLTTGLHWLCISVDADSHRFPYIINIVAQAVKATFKDQDNAASHFAKPLPAGSVAKLVDKPAAVKKVEQPFESYGAVPKEIGKEFWMRASERLRHKDRAITAHDYEKLVLEYFPDIFKVKCITHKDPNCNCRDIVLTDNAFDFADQNVPAATDGNNNSVIAKAMIGLARKNREQSQKIADLLVCCGTQVAPGHVTVIPIANMRNRNSVNILQPRTSRRLMLDIEKFLLKRTSPFVKVHARNPVYEEILLAFRVKFRPGVDKGYYLKKLNDEVIQFLTPWVFSEELDVPFTGKVYASAVINFIEERCYVDYVSDFMMYVTKCNCCSHTFLEGIEKILREYLLHEQQPVLKTDVADEVWDFIRDQSENVVEIAERLVLYWNNYSKQEQELMLAVIKWFIEKVKELGISDLLGTMKAFPDFTLTTMAEPSEARSILVSAPQHIILLEEDDAPLKPCQKKNEPANQI